MNHAHPNHSRSRSLKAPCSQPEHKNQENHKNKRKLTLKENNVNVVTTTIRAKKNVQTIKPI